MSDPRPSYHHGNLRAALVDAGLELTRSGGPAALVLRDATRRVGVSPNAAYRHFADRQSLLDAVATAVQERMAARMRDHEPDAASPDDPAPPQDPATGALDALRAVGLGYVEFALAEPGWFAVAFFLPRGPAPLSVVASVDAVRSGPPAPPAPFQRLTDALDRLVAAGVLDPARRPGAEWPCWSAVHGFAVLALQGPLRAAPHDQVWRAAERTVDAIIAGLAR